MSRRNLNHALGGRVDTWSINAAVENIVRAQLVTEREKTTQSGQKAKILALAE